MVSNGATAKILPITPRMRLESRQPPPFRTGGRLRQALYESGHTVTNLALSLGVTKYDMSNYLNGHRSKVGREKRRLIRMELTKLGFLKAPVKRVPVCQRCGLTYPTRNLK